jgi:hypothetical protein
LNNSAASNGCEMPLILLLLAAALVVKFVWLLAALVATVVVARLIGAWLARHDDRVIAARRRDAELCARADRQHAAVLAGDQRGVYGKYPPAPL